MITAHEAQKMTVKGIRALGALELYAGSVISDRAALGYTECVLTIRPAVLKGHLAEELEKAGYLVLDRPGNNSMMTVSWARES